MRSWPLGSLPSVATVRKSPLIKERAHEPLWKRLFPWATYPASWHERPIIRYSSRIVSKCIPFTLDSLLGSLPLAHLLWWNQISLETLPPLIISPTLIKHLQYPRQYYKCWWCCREQTWCTVAWKPSIYKQMNGWIICGIHRQQNIIHLVYI